MTWDSFNYFNRAKTSHPLSNETICSLLTRKEVESIIGKPVRIGRSDPRQNYSDVYYCEWRTVESIIPAFTLYYYTYRYSTLTAYAVDKDIKPAPRLSHDAIEVRSPSDHSIVQFVSYTDMGVISFVLFDGLAADSDAYLQAIALLDKTSQKAP